MNKRLMIDLPSGAVACLACGKAVWIIRLPIPSLNSECGRQDCPVNVDCRLACEALDQPPLFAYQISFAERRDVCARAAADLKAGPPEPSAHTG